ncbi:MAG TPA: alginate lyase family protein [Gaiellaceae bacterium]
MRAPGWYLARLRAMSSRELAWRASSAVAARLGPRRRLAAPSWSGQWPNSLRRLVETNGQAFVSDAERIAAGELELWGRRLETDPHALEWARDPFGGGADRKPLWELNRQQHLFPLAAGALLADRPDWARLCSDQILAWIEQRPRRSWESGYEAAHVLVAWAWTLPLVSHVLSDEERSRIGAAYAELTAFALERPSRYSSANNHRLAELAGLLGATAAGVELEWEPLWAELEREVAHQTYADGGSREQAGGYFLYVLEILWVAGVFARASGRSLGGLPERLEAMVGWLEAVARVDGEPPFFGDDAEDRLLRVEYFEPRRAATIAGRVRALLAGELTLLPAPVRPASRSLLLPESGLAVFRAGPAARVAVDVGELGFGSLAAHGHADALSLLLDVDCEELLRDSGTCAYAPPSSREPYRATAAHNTVVVDGRSQAEPTGPHIWGRRFTTKVEAHRLGDEFDHVRASHDGYRPVSHARSVSFLKPGLIVVLDRLRGPSEFEATLIWQLAAGASRWLLAVASQPRARRAEGDGPCSPRYTWCMEAPRSTWSTRGHDVVFATVVSLEGEPPRPILRSGEATTVELGALRLVERWQGAAVQVER